MTLCVLQLASAVQFKEECCVKRKVRLRGNGVQRVPDPCVLHDPDIDTVGIRAQRAAPRAALVGWDAQIAEADAVAVLTLRARTMGL